MSVVGDLVEGVVESALREILKKATGTGRRARRRKRTADRIGTIAADRTDAEAGQEAGQPQAHRAVTLENAPARLLIARRRLRNCRPMH